MTPDLTPAAVAVEATKDWPSAFAEAAVAICVAWVVVTYIKRVF